MHLTASSARRSLVAVAAVSMLVIGLAGTAVAAPSNDSFTNPTAVPPPLAKNHGVSLTGSNVGASTQPGEPSRSCKTPPDATVWYRYSPRRTHDGFAKATSRQSDPIAPVLAVYRVSPSGLHELGCNEDLDGNGAARVNFEAVRGITYLISVDGLPCDLETSPPEGSTEGFLCIDAAAESGTELLPEDHLGEGSFTLYVK